MWRKVHLYILIRLHSHSYYRVRAMGIRFDEEVKKGASLDIKSIAQIENQQRYYTPI